MITGMSKKLKHSRVGHWLALLAIGYLAMGAPLVHPWIHDHYGHSDGEVNLSGIVIQAAIADATEHDCRVCYLLGTSQVVPSDLLPAKVSDMLAASGSNGYLAAYGKSTPIPIIPRAPPFCRFAPIA